jgi:hypothetical protein
MTCGSPRPIVTAGVRRVPAVPDAVRTQRGPGCPYSRELGKRCWAARQWALARLSGSGDRPLLTVGDRREPLLRAGRGHGRHRYQGTSAPAMGHVRGRRSVVAEPYDDEGIAPALRAAEDPLVAFVAFGGVHDPTAQGQSSSFSGGFHVLSHMGFPARLLPAVPRLERTISASGKGGRCC